MNPTNSRNAALQISKEDFQKTGHHLINTLSEFYDTIANGPVTPGETPSQIRDILGNNPLPQQGRPVSEIIERAADLLLKHSLFNGHPKFYGYITSSPAPVGALETCSRRPLIPM